MPKGILWAVLQEPIAVPPIFNHGSPHHITLFYDVEKSKYKKMLGIEFEADAIACLHNKDIQAIVVLMPSHIPHKANPHITVSYREGIEPVASNELMINDRDRVIAPFVQRLKLKIEFFEFTVCDHHWIKNGTRKGVQQYICKHCKKSRSDGDRKVGRPFKVS